jgi:hypothetical protein
MITTKFSLMSFFAFFIVNFCYAGGSGGGGGVHPNKVLPSDYVRMQTLTNERILKFQYKPAESNAIQSYSVPVENISQQYLDALEKSASTKNWESIEIR